MQLSPLPRRLLALGLALASLATAHAQITENFSAGHGLAPGGLYSGVAEEGWSTPWMVKRPNPGVAIDRDVIDTQPLRPDTGNYLQVSGVSYTPGIWGIARQYAPYPNREYKWVRRDRPYTIKLLFRVDDLGGWSRGENITIGESQAATEILGVGPLGTFFVRAHYSATGTAGAETWALYNGVRDGTFKADRYVDSGIPLKVGTTYSFTFRLNPRDRSWQATIQDGQRSYTSDWLGYRAGGLGTGILAFLREANANDDLTTFSIDEIVIDLLN